MNKKERLVARILLTIYLFANGVGYVLSTQYATQFSILFVLGLAFDMNNRIY